MPGIDTDSVTEARARARAGYHGWSYHDGLDGMRVGDFADWAGPRIFHVSLVESFEGRNVRTIGAGGPTQKVWWQPQNQGHNDPSTFKGYFRLPDVDERVEPARGTQRPAVARAVTGRRRYEVRPGDTLATIARAHRTSVPAILRRNRARITDRNHIEPGWVLELP